MWSKQGTRDRGSATGVRSLMAGRCWLIPVLLLGALAMPEPRNPSGVTGANLPLVRQGASVTQTNLLIGLYDDAAHRINAHAAKAIEELGTRRSAEFRLSRAAQLQRQIREVMRQTNARSGAVASVMSRDSYRLGLAQARREMSRIGIRDAVGAAGGDGADGFALIDRSAVELVAQDMAFRLNASLASHADNADRVFRSLSAELTGAEPRVNQAIARTLITGDPKEADRAIREVFRDRAAPVRQSVRRLGAQQIQVGGWTGSVRDYADIVARTRTREATVTARHNRLQSNGLDLVQITGAVSRNFCTRFIGLVVVLGPARDGYPSIHELPKGGPPFHPRCSKGTVMYHPELSSSSRTADHARAAIHFRAAQRTGRLEENLA